MLTIHLYGCQLDVWAHACGQRLHTEPTHLPVELPTWAAVQSLQPSSSERLGTVSLSSVHDTERPTFLLPVKWSYASKIGYVKSCCLAQQLSSTYPDLLTWVTKIILAAFASAQLALLRELLGSALCLRISQIIVCQDQIVPPISCRQWDAQVLQRMPFGQQIAGKG